MTLILFLLVRCSLSEFQASNDDNFHVCLSIWRLTAEEPSEDGSNEEGRENYILTFSFLLLNQFRLPHNGKKLTLARRRARKMLEQFLKLNRNLICSFKVSPWKQRRERRKFPPSGTSSCECLMKFRDGFTVFWLLIWIASGWERKKSWWKWYWKSWSRWIVSRWKCPLQASPLSTFKRWERFTNLSTRLVSFLSYKNVTHSMNCTYKCIYLVP